MQPAHLHTCTMFNQIRTKLLAAFLIVVIVPLIGTGLYGNWVTSRIISERAVESARNDVRLRAEQIASFLNHVRGDVLYISHLDSLQYLVEALSVGNGETVDFWRQQAQQDFLIFSASRPEYYQVRYLDEFGREQVRVDSNGRLSEIIHTENLQNKDSRYYFQEAMKLPRGGIYVTGLDLNRENGEVEEPYIPVIRYATPLFDEEDQRRGVLIINVYADSFLDFLHENSDINDPLIMVNQNGYYLAHADETRLWGDARGLGTGENILRDYGSKAADILSGVEGKYQTASQVIVYTPLYPVRSDRDNYWVVMRDSPISSMLEPVNEFRATAVTILIFAIFVAMVMAFVLSRQLTAPILQLQEGVERFSQGELDEPIPIKTDDEIGQLTAVFNQMAGKMNNHVAQLKKLNVSSQRVSSGLNRQATLTAILESANDLFGADYCTISFAGVPDVAVGDKTWTVRREEETAVLAGQKVLTTSGWESGKLANKGYFCYAPLRITAEHHGLIELYGDDPDLCEPTCGSLLFTLAVESSIALENITLYERVDQHKERLKNLVEQLIDAQEAERKYVAYDLHDGLIQYLVAARMHLSKLSAICKEPKKREVLDETMKHLTIAVQEGRRVVEGLRPTLLDDLGLIPALNELARDVGQAAGWDVTFDNQLGDERLSPASELTAFRVTQEALSNARKHAKASAVTIMLMEENGRLSISVQDNGDGFDQNNLQQYSQCFGLTSMKERAAMLGGHCEIESEEGVGTAVKLKIPARE